MSLAATVKAMAAAGMTADQIADVVSRMEEERLEKKRVGNAERQRRFRSVRNACNADNALHSVTPSPSPKEKSPTPPKEITPTLTPSDFQSESSIDKPIDLTAERKIRERREKREAEEAVMREIGEGWNTLARSCRLAEINTIKGARESALRARMAEIDDHGFTDPLTAFNEVFARVRGSPFLLGKIGRPWKADFDFIVTPKAFNKILEGGYEAQSRSASYA